LATNDHFSSNWTSRVLGGKSHEFVVELLGVLAGGPAQTQDGVFVDAAQPSRLANATALGEVLQDRSDLSGRQLSAFERRALAFGETGLAGAAAQQAVLLGAVACRHGQVALAAPAEVGTLGVLATKPGQVVVGLGPSVAHGSSSCASDAAARCCEYYSTAGHRARALRHDPILGASRILSAKQDTD